MTAAGLHPQEAVRKTRLFCLSLGLACTFAMTVTPSRAQEFDCRAAATSSEKTICASRRLSLLDERMSRLYARLWNVSQDGVARESLRDYQRAFLAARDRCGNSASCIQEAYLDQIGAIEQRLWYSASSLDEPD